MTSPITWPEWLHGAKCLARFTGKLPKPLGARPCSIAKASGPSIISSAMWCDWSKSTTNSRHARCSSRQLVNSFGTTG